MKAKHETFSAQLPLLIQKCDELINSEPVTIDTCPRDTPVGGVYLFTSLQGQPLYVGRTKRDIRTRLKNHVNTAQDCPFAWHLVRERLGLAPPDYSKQNSKANLLKTPKVKAAYQKAKNDIRGYPVRYVGEAHPERQAILEIYVSMVVGAKYNDFSTT